LNAVQRAMQFREEPNDPVSPGFRPGLFVKRSPGPEGLGQSHHQPSAGRAASATVRGSAMSVESTVLAAKLQG